MVLQLDAERHLLCSACWYAAPNARAKTPTNWMPSCTMMRTIGPAMASAMQETPGLTSGLGRRVLFLSFGLLVGCGLLQRASSRYCGREKPLQKRERETGQTSKRRKRWFELVVHELAVATTQGPSQPRYRSAAPPYTSSLRSTSTAERRSGSCNASHGSTRKEKCKHSRQQLNQFAIHFIVPCCCGARGEAPAAHHLAAAGKPAACCRQRLWRSWHPRTGSPRRRAAETSAFRNLVITERY